MVLTLANTFQAFDCILGININGYHFPFFDRFIISQYEEPQLSFSALVHEVKLVSIPKIKPLNLSIHNFLIGQLQLFYASTQLHPSFPPSHFKVMGQKMTPLFDVGISRIPHP